MDRLTDRHGIRILNSFWLHILAMALMLCDHMWGTVVHGNQWMTNLGRLAFPIFAFMLVEGYFHTRNLKKYFLRLLVGAVISEIPFNLMLGGYWIDPFEQNVLWTFLIGLGCISLTERVCRNHRRLTVPMGLLFFALGFGLGTVTFVDYAGYGVLMVGVFYAFRGKEWWKLLLQAAGLAVINGVLFKGLVIDVKLFGLSFELTQQALAVFAMIPIALYNGEKGPGGKPFQICCYLFYPVHILILSLIALSL